MEHDDPNYYFKQLFNDINKYALGKGSIDATSFITSDNAEIVRFKPNVDTSNAFINAAGNYKFTTIVPIDANDPPNYIGALQESGAIVPGTFLHELLSFTSKNDAFFNSTTFTKNLYDAMYRYIPEDKDAFTDSDGRFINFTQGLPYSLYEPAIRSVHADICRQLNTIIDYAISTGQNVSTPVYDKDILDSFMNIFFGTDKTGNRLPRYYALRLGILPSAVSFARYLQHDKADIKDYKKSFENDLEILHAGDSFIPAGRSTQFYNTSDLNERVSWYPFYTNQPYSYYFDYEGDGTVSGQTYKTIMGLNHYDVTAKTNNETDIAALQQVTMTNDIDTNTINSLLSNGSKRTVLSYRSSLSNVPAPGIITITDQRNSVIIDDDGKICRAGIRSAVINDIPNWANPKSENGGFVMHPLLNPSVLDGYLNISAEAYPSTITNEVSITAEDDYDSTYYYNHGFSFSAETRSLDRLNFYGDPEKDKSCDKSALAFAQISDKLYTVTDNSATLTLNTQTQISPGAFGVMAEIDHNDWKTMSCGFTERLPEKAKGADLGPYGLFRIKTEAGKYNTVPDVGLDIQALLYNEPNGNDTKRLEKWSTINVPISMTDETDKDDSKAFIGTYNPDALYSLCNYATNEADVYYYTVHILSDDGCAAKGFTINGSSGMPDFDGSVETGVNYSGNGANEKKSRYGTGIQYFFAGKCSKDIYDAYYNKGLTIQQLLDKRSDIDSNTNNEQGVQFGRIRHGLRRANITFEWDYDVLLKAWELAGWILKGAPDNNKTGYPCPKDDAKCYPIYDTPNASIALAAFFDYIYADNRRLMLGPSLKQINNIIGPYGTDDGTESKSATSTDMVNLRGVTWEVVEHNKSLDGKATVYDKLENHAKAAAHIYALGTGLDYGVYGSTASLSCEKIGDCLHPWGLDRNDKWLDHYSYDWELRNNDPVFPAWNKESTDLGDNVPYKGAFMIHAEPPKNEPDNYKGKMNWHLAPFHDVSSESRKRTNIYGTRSDLSYWGSGAFVGPGGECMTSTQAREANLMFKPGWYGIVGYTHGDQNPNIRVRLPMLWRYLNELRQQGIYTDGQLMPCGVELHYTIGKKTLLSSITNVDRIVPASVSNTEEDAYSVWQRAVRDPASTVFAEVLKNTYAISTATLAKWYNTLSNKIVLSKLLQNVLETVATRQNALTSMYRAKRYINSISRDKLINGTTVFNIPILPSVSAFGVDDDTAIENNTNAIIMKSSMRTTFMNGAKPSVSSEVDKPIIINKPGIGITNTPVLEKGVQANQFSDISLGLYNEMLSFDGETIGWIVPIPTKSNLALLNAYDGSWRAGNSAVIPLTVDSAKDVITRLNGGEDRPRIHWIGWFIRGYEYVFESAGTSDYVQIENKIDNSDTNKSPIYAVVPMIALKIAPYYNQVKDCNEAPSTCNQTPFSIKLELDTCGTGDDSLQLVMMRDKMKDPDMDYSIYNFTKNIAISKANNAVMSTYMTVVDYNREFNGLPDALRPTE